MPGALQIIFADLGTPKPGEWSVYEELRSQLVARGLPREAVRSVHEAPNDQEKGELFAACRNGQVSVLVGSTERMGVGTNVQDRAIALHHLDCPWRPADIRQREGRILRQGRVNCTKLRRAAGGSSGLIQRLGFSWTYGVSSLRGGARCPGWAWWSKGVRAARRGWCST